MKLLSMEINIVHYHQHLSINDLLEAHLNEFNVHSSRGKSLIGFNNCGPLILTGNIVH